MCAKTVLMHQGFVGVEVGAGGVGLTGLQTCSSVSACPCCSARIREQRARTIEAAGVSHLRAGGQLVFITLTLPHDTGDPLGSDKSSGQVGLLDTVVDGWNAVQKSSGWRSLAKVSGITMASRAGGRPKRRLAFVRAVEVTHGRSGWHPHLHVLVFCEDLDDSLMAALVETVTDEWQTYVVGRGWRLPEQLDFQRIVGAKNAEGLARYLTKIQDQYVPGEQQWGIHREMTLGDRKRGKRWHTRSPFQLAESAADGSARDLKLWHEYEQATKGRRIIQPSQGLYRHLEVADLADELAPDLHGESVEVAQILPEDWKIVTRFRAIPDVLAAAAYGGGNAVCDVVDRLRGWNRALDLARERERAHEPIPQMSVVTVLAGYREAAARRGQAA